MRCRIAAVTIVLLVVLMPLPAFGQLDFLNSKTGSKYGLDPVAPGDLLGVVVDANDKGVAGATVYLRVKGRWGNRNDDQILKASVTDDRGQFVFRSLEPGSYALAAAYKAFSSRTTNRKWHEVDFALALDRDPVVLPLKPAREASIKVVDAATGEPIAKASVRVQWWDMWTFYSSDEQGTTDVAGMLPNTYTITVTAPGYAKQEQRLNLKRTTSGEALFKLKPGAVLTGVAVDPDGKPIGRPRPHLRDPINSGGFFDYTPGGADGRFRFEHAPTGEPILLDFARDDYQEPRTVVPPLKVGETRHVEVVLVPLPPGGSVAGVVTDERGEPISNALVSVKYQDRLSARTDFEGRFQIDDIDTRRDTLIVKAAKRAGRVVGFKHGTRDDPGEVTIALKPGNFIRGRVVNEAGEPIARAYVQFPNNSWGTAGENARTDAEGRFAFDNVMDNADFRISASGYSDRGRQKLPLNEDRVIEVVLAPEGIIKGRAVDAETGEPLPRFNVRMTFSPESRPGDPSGTGIDTDWGKPGRNYVSKEGHFEIDDLVVGQPMMVTVSAEGYRGVTERRVVAGRPEAERRTAFSMKRIDPDKLRLVAGVVVDSQGEPIANARVRLLASVDNKNASRREIDWYLIRGYGAGRTDDQLQQSMLATTDDQGRFRFEGVHADLKIQLACWGPGVAPLRETGIENLSREEQAALRIETTAAATLSVAFDAEAFGKINYVNLQPLDANRSYNPNLNTQRPDAEGRWVISDVAPGKYRLLIGRYERVDELRSASRSVPVHQEEVTIAPGETKRLDLQEPRLPTAQQSVLKRLTGGLSSLAEAFSKAKPTAKAKPTTGEPAAVQQP